MEEEYGKVFGEPPGTQADQNSAEEGAAKFPGGSRALYRREGVERVGSPTGNYRQFSDGRHGDLDRGNSSSAAAAYNYEEMEVGNVQKKRWADVTDEDEDGEWIEEMWGDNWEQALEENEVEDECEDGTSFAWDDVNGMELPMKEVRAARHEEMQHMIKERKFDVRTEEECYRVTGRAPISTKWVDTDKSHGQAKLDVRSRWVARYFRTMGEKDLEDLFSATPPL